MDLLILILICAAWFPLSVFLAVVLHETGHLIGGRLGGYRPAGFAVMGFMLHGGKLRRYDRKVLNAGQCFMYCDDLDRKPYALILGGCVANLVLGTVFLAASAARIFMGLSAMSDVTVLAVLAIPSAVNLCLGFSNLFFGSATSDGKTFSECRDSLHIREYNSIMRITGCLIGGSMFSRMPEELFSFGDDWRTDSLSAEMRLYCYWRGCELADTLEGFLKLSAEYGFDGDSWKTGKYFPDENMTEAAVCRVLTDLKEPEHGPVPFEPRTYLPGQLLCELKGQLKEIGPDFSGLPFPGAVKSYEKCLGNGINMMKGRKRK